MKNKNILINSLLIIFTAIIVGVATYFGLHGPAVIERLDNACATLKEMNQQLKDIDKKYDRRYETIDHRVDRVEGEQKEFRIRINHLEVRVNNLVKRERE